MTDPQGKHLVRLARQVRRTVTGPMWHGPALGEVLDGVTLDQALARPVGAAHSIAELVLHAAFWAEVAVQRLHENEPHYAEGDDWPPTEGMRLAGWAAAIDRLNDAYEALAEAVEGLGDRPLTDRVKGQEYSVEFMVRGVIEHGTYHGGQIALLRRALEPR